MTAPNLRQTQGSTPNNSPPSGPVSTSTCHAGRTPLSDREVAQSRSANSRSLYPHLQDSTSPAPPRRLSGQGRRCGDRDGIGSDLFPVAHYRRRRGSSRWRRMGQQPDHNRRGGGGHLARMGAAKPARVEPRLPRRGLHSSPRRRMGHFQHEIDQTAHGRPSSWRHGHGEIAHRRRA